MAVLNAVALVLAVRVITLAAVLGGVTIAYMTLDHPDPYRLGALAIYSLAVVLPCVWLASRR